MGGPCTFLSLIGFSPPCGPKAERRALYGPITWARRFAGRLAPVSQEANCTRRARRPRAAQRPRSSQRRCMAGPGQLPGRPFVEGERWPATHLRPTPTTTSIASAIGSLARRAREARAVSGAGTQAKECGPRISTGPPAHGLTAGGCGRRTDRVPHRRAGTLAQSRPISRALKLRGQGRILIAPPESRTAQQAPHNDPPLRHVDREPPLG